MEQQSKQWKTINIPNRKRVNEPFVKVSERRISFNSSVTRLWNKENYDYIETYIDTENKNRIAFKFTNKLTKNSLKITKYKNHKSYIDVNSKFLVQALMESTNIKINRYKAEYIDKKIVVNLTECI